ncbi:glycolate oxidase subunit GlcE [Labrys monachus]|uniref:Glycolate oxidase FAD binding subunit n=1 Tax=Labrys monachus TaxID=217067 RepID=A0ABU0F8L8_9HYPH|nr:glycolate oxidase subunit GlcE [Labrys monachus]MDQ0390876.1 glycolate oxidase FAD binding subunit [Labrys monachus]
MTTIADNPRTLQRFCPQGVEDVTQAIAEAHAAGRKLEIVGGGTKRSLGDPVTADALLDMSGVAGIDFYEPEELVIKVRAGTPIAEIRQALAEKKQHLAFEPPDYAAFFGNPHAIDTIGGIVACNLAGPRRIQAGAPRDAVLGVEAVNGRGEFFKGGGRTVKNVTGYDMPKLLTGSFGILAVLTSVTLKVLPIQPQEITLLASGLADGKAIDLLTQVLGMPFDVAAAAHQGGVRAGPSLTALRLEGFQGDVAARRAELESLIHRVSDVRAIADEESRTFWRSLRDLSAFAPDPGTCVWRVMLPATQAARVAHAVGGEAIYDWGGAEVFIRTAVDKIEAQARMLRAMADEAGGNACLFRASPEVRKRVSAFQPKPEALHDLGMRIRRMFDPKGILNPGKLGVASNGAL